MMERHLFSFKDNTLMARVIRSSLAEHTFVYLSGPGAGPFIEELCPIELRHEESDLGITIPDSRACPTFQLLDVNLPKNDLVVVRDPIEKGITREARIYRGAVLRHESFHALGAGEGAACKAADDYMVRNGQPAIWGDSESIIEMLEETGHTTTVIKAAKRELRRNKPIERTAKRGRSS